MFCDLDFCNHIHSGSHVLLGPFGPTLMGLIDILAEFAADYESDKLVKHVSTLFIIFIILFIIFGQNLPRIMSQKISQTRVNLVILVLTMDILGNILPLNSTTKSELYVFGHYF